jgi:hypothetical protein
MNAVGSTWQTPGHQVEAWTKVRSVSGVGYAKRRGVWREAFFRFSALSETELVSYAEPIERLRKASRDVLVLKKTDNLSMCMDRTVYGYFKDMPVSLVRKRGLHRKTYMIEEVEYP